MFIAREKKENNICEYLIYMFQVEDMVRSCNFDLQEVQEAIISQYNLPIAQELEVRDWYQEIITLMQMQKLQVSGHMGILNEIIAELSYLHNLQLNLIQDKVYLSLFAKAKPNILDLAEKADKKEINEVAMCLEGLYGLFLLRIQKKQISQETQDAMNSFSHLLAHLAKRYKEMKAGTMNLPPSMQN